MSKLVAHEIESNFDRVWNPDPEITTHNGKPIDPAREFFVPPPPEIGRVITANSTLVRGQDAVPLGWGIAVVIWPSLLIYAGFILGFGLMTGFFMFAHTLKIASVLASFIAIPIFLWRLFDGSRFRHYCTYVGEEGLASFSRKRRRSSPVQVSAVSFRDVCQLRVAKTAIYVNGGYAGTRYAYKWQTDANELRFEITGVVNTTKTWTACTEGEEDNLYWFGERAESVWTNRLLQPALIEFAANGVAHFPIGETGRISILPGRLELNLEGARHVLSTKDVQEVSIQDGSVQIQCQPSSDGSDRGTIQFPFAELSNGRLFVVLLEALLDLPLQNASR